MAVAVEQMGRDFSRLQKRAQKSVLTKYFGKCLMPDGSTSVLVAKSENASEASDKLHRGYKIDAVLDIFTAAEMEREWAKLKPSLIQRSGLY